MTLNIPLHPDDVLLFNEVAAAMRRVARKYKLPLRAVEAFPMPDRGMADRLGECRSDGTIRLVMRATVDGQFCDEPRTPEDIWRTAAHELAHLRHFNHGEAFQVFELEMREAVSNERVDHRQKLLDKLVKMQDARDGEARLGNEAAAEAFAAAINRMLIEHELSPTDVDYARTRDDDPIVELSTDLSKYRIETRKVRVAWQETLARIVANAHLCTFLIHSGSNSIIFVGTRSHATVAEYVYGTLVPAAQKMCDAAYHDYGMESIAEFGKWKAREPGFRESWMAAFTERIRERFDEARRAAVAQAAVDVPGGTSQALMRLDGQLIRVRKYVDDKFRGKASPLRRVSAYHAEGRARGRVAADAVPIGRRGVTGSSSPRKLLG